MERKGLDPENECPRSASGRDPKVPSVSVERSVAAVGAVLRIVGQVFVGRAFRSDGFVRFDFMFSGGDITVYALLQSLISL
jgi:hypothetical protein